jgi:hypothetical protein
LNLIFIARIFPKGLNFKSSYKWPSRFLECKHFDASSLAESVLALILGQNPPPWAIVLVDHTTVNGVQVVSAAIPFHGRAVPVDWVDFEYPWKTLNPPSKSFRHFMPHCHAYTSSPAAWAEVRPVSLEASVHSPEDVNRAK